MKLFLKKIAIFSLLAVLFYFVFLVIWVEFAPNYLTENIKHLIGKSGHSHTRMKEADTKKNIDILFLGSSHTYRGFNTEIFETNGYKTFNLGSSSQTPIQTKTLVKRYIKQLNPKLAIIEVYPIIFELEGVESALDLMANDQIDFYNVEEAIAINNSKVYNSLIYSWYRQVFNLDATYREPVKIKKATYLGGGFVQHDLTYYNGKDTFPTKEWKFQNSQVKALKELVEILKTNKINVWLVQAPYSKSVYNSYTNHNEVDSIFSSIAEYKNFNINSTFVDTVDFTDKDHLNKFGVEKFNKLIIDYVLQKELVKK